MDAKETLHLKQHNRIADALDSATSSMLAARQAAANTGDANMREIAYALSILVQERAALLAQHTMEGIAARRKDNPPVSFN